MDEWIVRRQITAIRERKGWSRSQLAQRTKGVVSSAVIANIENGRRGFKVEHVFSLAEALGVAVVDLFDEDSSRASLTERLETAESAQEKLAAELTQLRLKYAKARAMLGKGVQR